MLLELKNEKLCNTKICHVHRHEDLIEEVGKRSSVPAVIPVSALLGQGPERGMVQQLREQKQAFA